MEGKRFDSLAKKLATWSSRRKFLAGVTGVGVGGALGGAGDVSAQATPVADCGELTDSRTLSRIRKAAELGLANFPDPEIFRYTGDTSYITRPQFFEFVSQVKQLFDRGQQTPDEKWTQDLTDAFLNEAYNIIPTISVGFSGAWFSDKDDPEYPPAAVRGMQDTSGAEKSEICKGLGCLATCIHDGLKALDDCHHDHLCVFEELPKFIECLVGNDSEDPEKKKEGCLKRLDIGCGDDCCSGGCLP